MLKWLNFIILMIFFGVNFVSQVQQAPVDLVESQVITTENIADLQLITTLGEGRLNALDWHPNGEVLALARGSGICLLDELLEITDCFYEIGIPYDLAWDATGAYLAIIASTGLHIWTYEEANTTFVDKEPIAIIDGNCVAWNTDDELVIAHFYYEGQIAFRGVYNLTSDELNFLREFDDTDDFLSLLHTQCHADTDTNGTTLIITDHYFVGRTYDVIQRGDDERIVPIWERLGSLQDVAWQIPNETFTYIMDNGLVHFSLVLNDDGQSTGELIRTANLGSPYVNILRWSPDGNQLLSGDSYGEIFSLWSNDSGFISGDVSPQMISFWRGNATNEARIRWIDNRRISYESSDWYQGYFWHVFIVDSASGERVYTISMSMLYPYSDNDFPIFEWNPSYTAYMIFTDEGVKITRLLEEPEYVTYSLEHADFNTGVETEDYLFTDIPCEGYGWIGDRYFSCVGGETETIIDSYTGEYSTEPYVPIDREVLFYEIEVSDNYDAVTIIDTATGEATINLSVPVGVSPQTFRVISFDNAGLMTWVYDEGIRFWDVSSGEELLFIEDSTITTMALHPDRHILAVGTSTGLVYLYSVPQSPSR